MINWRQIKFRLIDQQNYQCLKIVIFKVPYCSIQTSYFKIGRMIYFHVLSLNIPVILELMETHDFILHQDIKDNSNICSMNDVEKIAMQ